MHLMGGQYEALAGMAGAAPIPAAVPAAIVKRSGFLTAVTTVNPMAGYAGRFGASDQQKSLVTQGASAGASIGSVVPVIGTAIGAVIGAVVGAIGAAFMGSKRPESELWDKYKTISGTARGIELDPAFRNGAFVGLFRLGKNTFPPRQRVYGGFDDKKFLDDMASQIAEAVKAGKLAAGDDAKSVFTKVVNPWVMTLGDWGKAPPDWQKWGMQILTDLIDAYLFDQPIVATSYTTSRHAQPRLSEVVAALPKAAPPAAPVPAPAPTAPAAPAPQPQPFTATGGKAPNGMDLYKGLDGRFYVWNGVSMLLYDTPAPTPQPMPAPAPVPAVVPAPGTAAPVVTPTGQNIDVAAMVSQLLATGASQQQAFLTAMQNLQTAGIRPTDAVQAAVASQVQAAGTGGGISSVAVGAGILAALGLSFALARPAKRGRR